MTSTLRELLKEYDNTKYATDAGSVVHKKLRMIRGLDKISESNSDIIQKIKSHPELTLFFTEDSMAEVPIAAKMNGKFVSRRIDRMVVDDQNKIVHILDYKTDVDRSSFRSKYVAQVQEYVSIIRKIYPKYRVYGYILWVHDWVLEKL